ncbi:hypothetical protein [Marinivivus vitaminiproducens]|uniref:hypothetical protein n=1 Tax=Marinivivus vitaminiproducens TaxID=3035935 RepID=UPI0027A097BD|nr:hypothetical protein P4R82_09945 [Geminicoccaceae bacterium SCSIO 64248]
MLPDRYATEVARTGIAITGVQNWYEVAPALQPNFGLSTDQALKMAGAVTAAQDILVRQATSARAGIGLNLPNVNGATTRSVEDTLTEEADPSSGISNKARVRSTVEEVNTTRAAADIPTASNDLLDRDSASDRLGPIDTLDNEPFRLLGSAASIYQEARILDRVIDLVGQRKGYVPYLVRLQLSVQAERPNRPYDVVETLSFTNGSLRSLPGIEPSDRETLPEILDARRLPQICDPRLPRVVPLLVAESSELVNQSAINEKLRQIGLALALQYGTVGSNVGIEDVDETIRRVIGREANSLLAISRAGPNQLRVRLGARRGWADDAPYVMNERPHNITLLVFMPDPTSTQRPSECFSDTESQITVTAQQQLVHALTGEELPQSNNSEFRTKITQLIDSLEVIYAPLPIRDRRYAPGPQTSDIFGARAGAGNVAYPCYARRAEPSTDPATEGRKEELVERRNMAEHFWRTRMLRFAVHADFATFQAAFNECLGEEIEPTATDPRVWRRGRSDPEAVLDAWNETLAFASAMLPVATDTWPLPLPPRQYLPMASEIRHDGNNSKGACIELPQQTVRLVDNGRAVSAEIALPNFDPPADALVASLAITFTKTSGNPTIELMNAGGRGSDLVLVAHRIQSQRGRLQITFPALGEYLRGRRIRMATLTITGPSRLSCAVLPTNKENYRSSHQRNHSSLSFTNIAYEISKPASEVNDFSIKTGLTHLPVHKGIGRFVLTVVPGESPPQAVLIDAEGGQLILSGAQPTASGHLLVPLTAFGPISLTATNIVPNVPLKLTVRAATASGIPLADSQSVTLTPVGDLSAGSGRG